MLGSELQVVLHGLKGVYPWRVDGSDLESQVGTNYEKLQLNNEGSAIRTFLEEVTGRVPFDFRKCMT